MNASFLHGFTVPVYKDGFDVIVLDRRTVSFTFSLLTFFDFLFLFFQVFWVLNVTLMTLNVDIFLTGGTFRGATHVMILDFVRGQDLVAEHTFSMCLTHVLFVFSIGFASIFILVDLVIVEARLPKEQAMAVIARHSGFLGP